MPRVEWAALSGDEVEAVVSNLLYNEFPHASRIRPSQGDFGIDVLVPTSSSPKVFDVYQIKKFATNLESSEKRQIQKSFRRVLVGLVRKQIPIGNWYLTMPLDPTIENRMDWFNDMPDKTIAEMFADSKLALTETEKLKIQEWRHTEGRAIEWKGHLFCEALTSKYWFVADYYLHGGNERIRAAVSAVSAILQRDISLREQASDAVSILTPSEVADHLRRLQATLDGDPHFRYGVSFHPHETPITAEAGLVAATQEVAADGSCITFSIYQRSNESLNERPIPIHLDIEVNENSLADFDMWREYGKPVTLPATLNADLPGGLGGKLSGGTVSLDSADGATHENRYRVLTPSGETAGEVAFTMKATTGLSGTGRWFSGTDSSGAVTIEAFASLDDRSLRARFEMNEICGLDPTLAAPAIAFMAALGAPNSLQVAAKYGPFVNLEENLSNDDGGLPDFLVRYVNALTTLQSRTAEPIFIPDFSQTTGKEIVQVINSASLIGGKVIVKTWDRLTLSSVLPGTQIDTEGEYQISVLKPLRVNIGTQNVALGTVETIYLSASMNVDENGVHYLLPTINNSAHERFAPEESLPTGEEWPVRMRAVPKAQ
ncbi:hypothetical protein [Streptomyces sp. NPDC051577]|uniref:hypothetical protein n=1 Tax=Streptomyces sp. NPDC051577 TaxID=3155166 RepID=UPI003436F099